MIMTKKYEIVLKYIKDLSVEIPDAETFIFSRDLITKYTLGLNITTKAMKNNMIEVITKLSYIDPHKSRKKSYFEILYASVVKINDKNLKKDELEKIILCDVQNKIYPDIEKSLLDLLHNSGYPGISFEKKVDFDALYKQKIN